MRRTKWKSLFSVATALCLLAVPATSFAATVEQDTEATITFTAGDLELLSAPNLDFGTVPLATAMQNQASSTAFSLATATGNIKVSDMRGNKAGWTLTATLDDFNGASNSLKAANITFTSIAMTAGTGAVTADAPTFASSTATCPNGGTAGVANVLTASTGTGYGIWESSTVDAELAIPLDAVLTAGQHKADLHWKFASTP